MVLCVDRLWLVIHKSDGGIQLLIRNHGAGTYTSVFSNSQ